MILSLLFVVLGFINDKYRGSVLTSMITIYVFLGSFAGYYSARFYKMFNGGNWLWCTILSSTLYPGINFICFSLINFFMHLEESSAAVHFKTIFELFIMWFGISTPLVFFGSFLGFKR